MQAGVAMLQHGPASGRLFQVLLLDSVGAALSSQGGWNARRRRVVCQVLDAHALMFQNATLYWPHDPPLANTEPAATKARLSIRNYALAIRIDSAHGRPGRTIVRPCRYYKR